MNAMKNYVKNLKLFGLATLILVFFSNCSDDDGEKEGVEEETGFRIEIATNSTFGKILVNQDNQSMYFFANDVNGQRNCAGNCASVWPPVTGELYELELGANLDVADFATIAIENGLKQITYKGWPLYYFSTNGDGQLEPSGATEGDGKNGTFHIAKPDYTLLLGRQPLTEGGDPVVYLVDDKGVSLYLNTGDEENKSNCAGGCAGVWPPFKDTALVLPSSMATYDFGTVDREDDLGPQLSFEGSPVYFFSQDEGNRGSVLGQEGGPNKTFFVVEPVL